MQDTDGAQDAGSCGSADGGPRSPSSIVGACDGDDDCTLVLNYRDGFTCWAPSPASRADLERDHCFIEYHPDPRCSTPPPPADCPCQGSIPVDHSCLAYGDCITSTCTDGKCAVDVDITDECTAIDAGAPDCEMLRQALVEALEKAAECDPTQTEPNCQGNYADTCGCEAPYDLNSPYSNAAYCAFHAWANAHCPIVDCGRTCVRPTSAGAACAPDSATSLGGTCRWIEDQP